QGMETRSAVAMGYDPYFIQTTFEIIQSDRVLSNVVAGLNLDAKWAKSGEKLEPSEATAMLKQRLNLHAVPNTELIEIGVKDGDPQEAADLANAVAISYSNYRAEARRAIETNQVAVLEQQYAQLAKDIQSSQKKVDRLG